MRKQRLRCGRLERTPVTNNFGQHACTTLLREHGRFHAQKHRTFGKTNALTVSLAWGPLAPALGQQVDLAEREVQRLAQHLTAAHDERIRATAGQVRLRSQHRIKRAAVAIHNRHVRRLQVFPNRDVAGRGIRHRVREAIRIQEAWIFQLSDQVQLGHRIK